MIQTLEALPPPRQRLLALLLLLLLLLSLYLLLVQPYLDLLAREQVRISALLKQRERLIAKIAQEHFWQQEERKLKAHLEQSPIFLEGGTPSVAVANLQERLRKLVETAGGELLSLQTLPERPEEGLVWVGVSMRLRLSTRSLKQLLYTIETSRPLLLVERLEIVPDRGYFDRKTRRYHPLDKLQVTLQVSGVTG